MRCGIKGKQVGTDLIWHAYERCLLMSGSIVLLEGPEADMVRDKTALVHQMYCLVNQFQPRTPIILT